MVAKGTLPAAVDLAVALFKKKVKKLFKKKVGHWR